MAKYKNTHHFYLGAGGVIAVAALVVALTFGLSSAQTQCGSGMHWDTGSNSCMSDQMPSTCPSGYTGTPPNCTSTSPAPAPAPAPIMCANGSQAPNNDMNQCPKCPDGSYMPGSGTCPQTAPAPSPATGGACSGSGWQCSNGWTTCQNGSWICPTTGTTPPSSGTNPSCPSGQVWMDSMCKVSCSNGTYVSPGTTCPSNTGTNQPSAGSGTSCGSSQYWDSATSTCKPMSSMRTCGPNEQPTAQSPCYMPSGSGSTGSMSTMYCPALNRQATSQECGNATPVCGQGQTPATHQCKYPDSGNYSNNGASTCGNGMYWDNTTNTCKTMSSGSTRACGVNEYPTPQNPCVMQGHQSGQTGTQNQPPSGGCQAPTSFWNGTSCIAPIVPPPSGCAFDQYWDGTGCKPTTTSQNGNMMRACGPNEYPTPQNPCMMQGYDGSRGSAQPGQYMPGQNGAMPWTGTMPGNFTQGSFMPGMRGTDGMPMNVCETNPDDPYCKAGFNMDYQKQNQFDQSQFDPSQYRVGNLKNELRNLQREAKDWVGEAKQARRQLTEISRESSGFACPVAVEVESLVAEFENAANKVLTLSEASTKEEIQTGLALREHINGRWDQATQISAGVRSKLYGGMDQETGDPIPGKMMGLGVCREISGMIYGACEAAKHVEREYNQMKKYKAPEAVLSVFAEVLPQIQERCTNPLGALAKAGVSIDELSKPFMPDPEVCSFGGFGGPMPMPGPFPMGGPGNGPRGSFGPGFNEDRGFNDARFFQNSTLTAQAQPSGFEDDFDGEFEGGFGGGYQMPEECMSPVHRYLGFDDLMRKLDSARFEGHKFQESSNYCDMFRMGYEELQSAEKSGTRAEFGPPPEVKPLLVKAIAACDAGDSELVEELKEEMFAIGNRASRGGPRGRSRQPLAGLVDVDQLVEDKLNAKLAEFLDEEEGEDESDELTELKSKMAELTNQLSEAQKTIFALKENMAEMATKLASAVKLTDEASRAAGAIAQFANEEVQQKVAEGIGQLADKVEAIKQIPAVTAAADAVIDETLNALIESPPSSRVLSEMKEAFTAIQSYASSGATKAEVTAKVKEELADIATLNEQDVGSKIAEGIVATADTADLSQWYALPTLQAKESGFVSKDIVEFKPAEPESKCAAITRTARILEKAGELEIDEANKAPVAGAPEWCRPFVHALQGAGVDFAQNLRDPNASADRIDIAVLMYQALGDNLPAPENVSEYLTPDTRTLTPEMQAAVATMRFHGVMDTVDGTNFGPAQDFNRAQNALVSVRAYEAVQAEVGADAQVEAGDDDEE